MRAKFAEMGGEPSVHQHRVRPQAKRHTPVAEHHWRTTRRGLDVGRPVRPVEQDRLAVARSLNAVYLDRLAGLVACQQFAVRPDSRPNDVVDFSFGFHAVKWWAGRARTGPAHWE